MLVIGVVCLLRGGVQNVIVVVCNMCGVVTGCYMYVLGILWLCGSVLYALFVNFILVWQRVIVKV